MTYLYNKEIVFKELNILTPKLANYVFRVLRLKYEDKWWREGVLGRLDYKHTKYLPKEGNDEFLIKKLDIDKLTILIADIHWETFSKETNTSFRTYIRELRDIRNAFVAHIGSEDIKDSD